MKNTHSTITETSLSEMANCPLETIRKATTSGILCAVSRTDDGAPLYLASATLSLKFALHAWQAGFDEQEIRMMIAMIEMFGGGEEYIEEVIADHLRALTHERERLLAVEQAVIHFRSWCHTQPNGFASLATAPQAVHRGMLS